MLLQFSPLPHVVICHILKILVSQRDNPQKNYGN